MDVLWMLYGCCMMLYVKWLCPAPRRGVQKEIFIQRPQKEILIQQLHKEIRIQQLQTNLYSATTQGNPYSTATQRNPYSTNTKGIPYSTTTQGNPYSTATQRNPYSTTAHDCLFNGPTRESVFMNYNANAARKRETFFPARLPLSSSGHHIHNDDHRRTFHVTLDE